MAAPDTSTHEAPNWVIGPRETAGVVHAMAARAPGSYTISLAQHPYYSHHYDTNSAPTGRLRSLLRTVLVGPFLLGWLANRAPGSVYVGFYGLLIHQLDGRRFEFTFLQRRGIKIACYWCGSDIRSTQLMRELERKMNLPNISTYMGYVRPSLATPRYEETVRLRAEVTEVFADIVFTFPTAQRSYLTELTEPVYYFTEEDRFDSDDSTFDDLHRIVVAHSASSPTIEGTRLVRAFVAELRAQGYDFH
jgi:hypothetical protein